MKPYFIYNEIDSRDYLIVNRLPSIFKPAKDVQKIEISGRDGFITEDNETYKSIIKTVECTIRDLTQMDFICSWLTNRGNVIFSNEEDRIYKATIINQIEFTKILRNFHRLIIQFECQPFGYSIDNSIITLTTSPATVTNPCNNNSEPIIKIYGNDNIDLTINDRTIHLTNVVDYAVIDSELMDCYKDTVLQNNNMLGDFPILEVGNNTISWTGTVAKLEITPNWRWL